ncbi:MAG TPA: Gfo/Idh/MocA family oxidoreductase [Fimbriimonadaceae bacterium]|nr:Gfo/Idh/MocA family oxidoreductase [Fimbriimonadaceae bacterium]
MSKHLPSRRQVLQAGTGIAASALLPRLSFPSVHPGGSDLIQVALVGCGGRGGGAAVNAISTTSGPIKLVAMADVFQDRLDQTRDNLVKDYGSKMDVPKERQFIGFDAYKHAMDALKPGDVVILTTPPAFRWVHFTYAISKKLNVFMEKPVTVDGPTSRRMLKLADEATAANLKVGVGLMSRHARNLQELHERVQNGEIGDVVLMRGYRMQGVGADSSLEPKPANVPDVEYQIRHFHAFLWASGGLFNDFFIHHIDHLCWMKNAWPVKAQAVGGKHFKTNPQGLMYVDQNFDAYSVEYTFADGAKMFFDGRCMDNVEGIYSSYVHGSKGSAIAARAFDCNGPSAIFDGQNVESGKARWTSTDRSNPYQNEWDELVLAIRNDKPYNEVKRGVEACVAGNMGRYAAHTGQVITFDDMLNHDHEFAPDVDKMNYDSTAPVQAGTNGRYPQPQPGANPKREY